MARTTKFKGEPLELKGKELRAGDKLPPFKLTGTDMGDVDNKVLLGKVAIVLSVPSLDTPVCAIETKRFNDEANSLGNKVEVLVVSRDLPFAQKRWCGLEGAERVTLASDYKYRNFAEAFGVHIVDWDLLSRAVFVAGPEGTIRYVEYVPEVSQEPAYGAALEVARSLLKEG